MFGLGLDYGLGFRSDIRLRQDPQLRVSHLATTLYRSIFYSCTTLPMTDFCALPPYSQYGGSDLTTIDTAPFDYR